MMKLLLTSPLFVSLLAVVHAGRYDSYEYPICHPLMIESIYSHDASISTYPDALGAIGVNIGWTAEYFIEQQRAGADWLQSGICEDFNATKIDLGKLILEYGFHLEADDGSFPQSGDAVHSTSLFLEAAARSAYILKKNGDTGTFRAYREYTTAMALYMSDPTVTEPGKANNLEPFNHRYFLRAAGIQTASLILNRNKNGVEQSLLNTSALTLVEQGLALQRVDGVMPENGGFDFNYQAIGIGYLFKYFRTARNAGLTREFKRAMRQAVKRSLPLFQARVDILGNVDLRDSTRISEPSRSGRPKSLDTKNIIQAFIAAHDRTNKDGFLELATRLAHPVRPIVEYIFDRPDTDGQKNSGSAGDEGDLFCRIGSAKDSTPLGTSGSGISGDAEDYAYEMAIEDGAWPYCRTDSSVPSLEALSSFTMTGWYRTRTGQLGETVANIELFKTDKIKLTSPNAGKLRLYVGSSSNVVSTNADWTSVDEWSFFAVTYNGLATSDNVQFYTLDAAGGVALSSVQTLNAGVVPSGGNRFFINREDRSLDGYLDNMRVYGSQVDSTGALTLEQLQALYTWDTLESN